MWALHKVEWQERALLWIGDSFWLDQCSVAYIQEQWAVCLWSVQSLKLSIHAVCSSCVVCRVSPALDSVCSVCSVPSLQCAQCGSQVDVQYESGDCQSSGHHDGVKVCPLLSQTCVCQCVHFYRKHHNFGPVWECVCGWMNLHQCKHFIDLS